MSAIPNAVAVDDQLCFQLYATSRAVTGAYREGLGRLGLTYPQYVTMLAVLERDGRTVSELCDALSLDSGTVSPILVRLESEGWVKKVREGSDGRSVRIFCTEAGIELGEQVALVRAGVEAATGLKSAEFTQLRGLLQQVGQNLDTPRPSEE